MTKIGLGRSSYMPAGGEPMKPVGVIPGFRRQTKAGDFDVVPVASWKRLSPPAGVKVPQLAPPDLGSAAELLDNASHGLKRLSRRRLTYSVRFPAEHNSPDATEPEIETVSVITPPQWTAGQVPNAYQSALDIAEAAGFDLDAAAHWAFADDAGDWWALADEFGDLQGPSGDPGEPGCWLIQKDFDPACVPVDFFDALGGPDGPLEWAFQVIWQVERVGYGQGGLPEPKWAPALRKLVQLPEWGVFAENIRKLGDPDLDQAVHRIRYLAGCDGTPPGETAAFEKGFELGETFGFLSAADALRQSETARNAGKIKLREALREIAVDEAKAAGGLQPYSLAVQLMKERDQGTPRGQRLAQLGLGADANNIGKMIREEATEAGVL